MFSEVKECFQARNGTRSRTTVALVSPVYT